MLISAVTQREEWLKHRSVELLFILLLIGKEETNSKLLLFVIKIEAFMLHASIFSYDKRLVLISYPY